MKRNATTAKKAADWVKNMKDIFPNEIQYSISNSNVVRNYKMPPIPVGKYNTIIEIIDMKSEDATYYKRLVDNRVCVLNFASYKNPGGAFLDGAMAQEEALCHHSTLYPVLAHFRAEYASRKTRLNNGLYNEDFIYSPDILFFNADEQYIKADILTYAAPNMMRKAKTEEYYKVLKQRIYNAYVYPSLHGADTVILGAWGCGVFCNDPDTVAQLFAEAMRAYPGLYDNVVYAVPTIKNSKNYDAFKRHIEMTF